MTGQEMTDMCREVMDAVSSTAWSDATIRTWLGQAQWKLQGDLLGVNNTYYTNSVSVTQDASGQFTVASLSTGSGDSKKYFFRVLSVAQPTASAGQIQFYYRQSRYQDFPNPQPNTALPYVWYRLGTAIQLLPIASGQSATVMVNYRPPRVDQLSLTSVAVDFPDGYETLVPWWAASTALVKGGSEVQGAASIRNTAEEMRNNFLEEQGRQGTWPIIAGAFDDPSDYNG